MTYQCPACKRSFAEPGFCPYDGTKLAQSAPAEQPTVLSAYHRAQSDADQSTTNKLKAISAHEGHADAVDTIRKGPARGSEYDRLIGETLDGRYYVQRRIGEGGMGVVFAVKHAVIERPLAIKVLKKEVMRDNATIQRFVQEAKAASRIGHPNIVDVTDFGKTPDGMTYSVMEYVEGSTLSKTIKEAAPLPPARAVRIASQIARALAAAHGKGIVHRDLKPENVFLVDRDGRPDFVKIVDFGIAKVQPVEGTDPNAPRLTRAGSVFGTPEYMAPEQAAGKSDTDGRVDIYALGCILYEMLVGKTPLKGDSMIRTIAMQMLDPIVPPSQVNPELAIPPALEAIVMKTLEKKREDRYASMNELLAAFEAIAPRLAEGPSLSVPPLPPGADPLYSPPSPTTMLPGAGDSSSTTMAKPPRRAKPATRPLHEPQFVAPGLPVSFTHLDEEPPPSSEQSSRWPMIVAGLLVLLLGAGGMIFVLSRLQKNDTTTPVAETPKDAAVVVEHHDDAGVIEAPEDAQVVIDLPPDAGTRVVTTGGRDAGVGGAVITTPKIDKTKPITIEVLTRPAEAEVWIGPNFRGPSGVKIRDSYGAKSKIECKTANMKGSVNVVFDGKITAVMCTATRARFCVPGSADTIGLKNPYDDCEQPSSNQTP